MYCTGFLLLCVTSFAPQTIENLCVHKLTLPHENLKLKNAKATAHSLHVAVASGQKVVPEMHYSRQVMRFLLSSLW